jgi:ubiquitin carboxyl-terminal hydrolase 5/13
MMMIMSMGLTEKQALRGLRKCNNDVERAMDWIFSHMDEPDSEDNEMIVD